MLLQTLAVLLLVLTTISCQTSNPSTQADQSLQSLQEVQNGHFSDPSAKAAVFKHIDDMTFIEVPRSNWTDGKRAKRNAVINRSQLWPNGRVPYVIADTFSTSQRDVILRAMRHWEDNTCIRFHPRKFETYYIIIMSGNGCTSYVGRLRRSYQPQGISLGRGCVYFKIVVHELGHAVGFYHEHVRPDRDEYIEVITDNIRDRYKKFFVKARPGRTNTLGYGYDYASVMHYRSSAFSKNNSPTIVAKDEGIEFARTQELSPLDILKANRLYGCVAGRHPPISTIPQSKKPLTLPEGITCGGIMEGRNGTFYSPGYPDHVKNQKCAWVIRVPDGFDIRLNFPGLNLEQSTECSKDYVQVFRGRSLDPSDGVYLSRRASNGKFCSLSQLHSTSTVRHDTVTIYYRTDANNAGLSPQGLRIDFSTRDIDECRRFHKCHNCTNFVGSYECQCNDGYYHSPAANTCFDINECAYDNGGCEHTCDNTGGSYRCVCDNGFYLQADGLSCARTPPGPTVNFMLHGKTYQNNANVEMNDIGVGDNALLCMTDQTSCCRTNKEGEFYYPDGTAVGWSATNPLFRDRGSQVVRLNRRNNVLSPLGRYRCDIPDSSGVTQSIYINIIASTMATTNPTTQPTTRPPTTSPPITCGGTLTSLSGTIQTPQWPETYPFNFDCQWNFELAQSLSSTNCMLELTFVGAFGIAGKTVENCPKDHLKIYESTRLIHTICDLARPSPITTTTNARLAFHAGPDHDPLRKGFKIMYQTVCPSTPPPTTRPLTTLSPTPNCPVLPNNPQGVFGCGSFIDPKKHISFGPGNFPSGPMTDPVTCNWIVIGRSAARFRVRFKYFDIPSTDECSDNYVAVYDGYGTTTPLLDKICGEKCEQYVTEGTSSIMTVRLVVTSPGPFRGFYAQFEQI